MGHFFFSLQLTYYYSEPRSSYYTIRVGERNLEFPSLCHFTNVSPGPAIKLVSKHAIDVANDTIDV